jgi:nitroreductase
VTAIDPLLAERWSPRAFSDRPVAPDLLLRLFEAARWAPSCYNDQPWYFLLARRGHDDDAYQRLLSCLVPFNQAWAATAPVLMLSIARVTFFRNGKPNIHAWYDVGQAVGNLLCQATALGLYVHQMAGFDATQARALFAVPAGYDPIAVAALGYRGDPAALPPEVEEKSPALRERKPLGEFVFDGGWNVPLATD